jgi:diguanylate cyclase (GGDEF)-like protein/PAS domain S-box-containing protein
LIIPFRAKAIIGIASIEALLLSILIISVLGFLRDSNQQQLLSHANITTSTFAAMSADAIISHDLDRLQSSSNSLSHNPGIIFVRILDDQQRELVKTGDLTALQVPFIISSDLHQVTGKTFNAAHAIEIGGVNYGSVQIGFDISYLEKTLSKAIHWSLGIAGLEMLLVALFSMTLGSYLTKQIAQFTRGAEAISLGNIGKQLTVTGNDEIAQATKAFNRMSLAIKKSQDSLEDQVKAQTKELNLANNKLRHLLGEQSTLLDNQSVGIATVKDRKLLWCNPAFIAMMGYDHLDELIGHSTQQFYLHEADFIEVAQAYQALSNKDVLRRDFQFVRKDGRPIWVDLSGSRLPSDNQSLWVIVDVTARVDAQAALRRSEIKFRALFESTSEAIMLIDHQHLSDCNQAALKIFGCQSKQQFCLVTPTELSAPTQPCGSDSTWLIQQKITLAQQQGSLRFDWLCKRLDTGQYFPAEVLLSLVEYDGHSQLLAAVWDMSERVAMMREIEQQAQTDYLTGLCNRRYFIAFAERELEHARRYKKPLAILAIDIDFFKSINDNYGHSVGDLTLQKFASVCHEVLRESDLLGRIGGEEFAVLLPETDADQAQEISERLRYYLAECRVIAADQSVRVQFTVSIGITLFSGDNTNIEDLLNRADIALYQAKHRGRNQVVMEGSNLLV